MEINKQRELLQELISSPKHKGLNDNERNKAHKTTVAACEDLFNIYIDIENEVIKEAKYDGEGCSISTASIEAVLRTIKGKNTKEVNDILNSYDEFIDGNIKETNYEILNVFEIVQTHLSRKKCAKAPIETIRKAIK